ncbi:MAG: 2-phospho-L-lactate transferase [Terriglobales bacterium]
MPRSSLRPNRHARRGPFPLVALAGGVGGSKLLLGLAAVMDPRALTIVVNTGDDIVLHGLHIAPDLDIVTYTLAGAVNRATGWGLRREGFRALSGLVRYGGPPWFHLGDADLATHIHRTDLLRRGYSLSAAAESIRRAWGVPARVLPMCDEPVPTMIHTPRGVLHFQQYLVRDQARPRVRRISFRGVRRARPAPGVLPALRTAAAIVLCPSNPLISIGPILAVPGIRQALRRRRREVVAVSPIVGGRSLKGPSDRMLRQLGFTASAAAVAALYRDVCGTFVLDVRDAGQQPAIEALGMRVVLADTIMRTGADKRRLGRRVLALCRGFSSAGQA